MMRREVRGCLSCKNNHWYVRLFWYEVKNGKRIRKERWIATGLIKDGNKRNAERYLKDLIREKETELQEGIKEKDPELTVSGYMLSWLEYRKVDKIHPLREDTYEGYERKIKLHVVPYFDQKGTLLKDLTAEDLDAYYNELLQRGYSVSSVRKTHANIHAALKRAVKLKLVFKNVADDIERLPTAEKRKGDFYDVNELLELLRESEGDPLETVIRLTAFFGLRRSEVLGLKWESVDLDNRLLTIRSTAIQTKAGVTYVDTVKSASSYRTLLIPDDMVTYLQKVKAKQAEEKEMCGEAYNNNDFVCKWSSGNPIKPDYVSHHFVEFLASHGLRHIRFHDLRHSAASFLLSQGMMIKDVQEFLGHSTIAITADIYGHLDRKRKEAIAEKMNSGLGSALQNIEKMKQEENSRIFSRKRDGIIIR